MNYLSQLQECFKKVESQGPGRQSSFLETVVKHVIAHVVLAAKRGNKIMIIGNGGSAAIASHMAIDLLKNGRIPAMAFNDPCSLTCLSNDLGYGAVFACPLEMLAKKGDVLFAISSSGKSASILNAVKMARKKKVSVVTLSGFSPKNPLRKMGDFNFFVPSDSYGFVELTHSALCHWVVDRVMQQRSHG